MSCRPLFFGLLAITLPLGMGCGSTVSVSGHVTYNGKPIPQGSISFEAADGSTPTLGGSIVNGEYSITNQPATQAGKKVVRIVAGFVTGRKVLAGPPFPPDQMTDEIKRLPQRFNEKSELTAELSAGKSHVENFDLRGD